MVGFGACSTQCCPFTLGCLLYPGNIPLIFVFKKFRPERTLCKGLVNFIMKDNKIIYQVDAFTTEAFKGNPAGVCILDHEPETTWMQNIAMEMNLSETAFVFPGRGSWIIRFFTPEVEMKLCGHATLSASHSCMKQELWISTGKKQFSSKAGFLIISKAG